MTPIPEPGRFQPRLTLQTLGRGDGLLGMRGMGPFGPRGGQVTVAQVDWTYRTESGLSWETPAPRPGPLVRLATDVELRGAWGDRVLMRRDRFAEGLALERIRAFGLHPLPDQVLQWRGPEAAWGQEHLWSLLQEDFFGDFWADAVPQLQAEGWSIVTRPGFAHESVPVEAWKLIVSPETGEVLGKEVAGELAGKDVPALPLALPRRAGSWLVTLGIEVDGKPIDLVPMLAELIKRDRRWLNAGKFAAISATEVIRLRAPGGRRIEAPAGPLKTIVGAMLDLLTERAEPSGPLRLSPWDLHRLDSLDLHEDQARRAGGQAAWQVQGETGLADLAHRLRGSGSPRPVQQPEGLGLKLRSYQLQGLAWLQYLREHDLAGILADDMGLGKTAQTLAHVLAEKQAGRLDRPALVVLPTSLIFNWQAEAKRITPALRVLTLHGPRRAAHYAHIPQQDLVITTYPLLWRDLRELERHPFHLLILDEAQTVKNAAGRAASAVRRIDARHRLCLTGTPLENHLGELWTQFDFLMPGFLGTARQFKHRFRDPIEKNAETLRARVLAQRVRPFILRRSKDEVATELPPKTEVIEYVQLQGRQRQLYESVRLAADKQVKRALDRLGFAGARISILDAMLKLRQLCCDPLLLKQGKLPATIERAKVERLREMLPELVEEGRRILLFSQFTEMLELIADELKLLALPYLMLTGDTPAAARGEVVGRFQAQQEPILLISLKAGGLGLNLTAADTVIHADPWWNPAVERQATDRAHRLGQTQRVFVYKLVVEGSIEERMLELQSRKRALADGVLGEDGEEMSKFGEADLAGLLAPLPDED
jgi:superfamily II DNA or RNA helicase